MPSTLGLQASQAPMPLAAARHFGKLSYVLSLPVNKKPLLEHKKPLLEHEKLPLQLKSKSSKLKSLMQSPNQIQPLQAQYKQRLASVGLKVPQTNAIPLCNPEDAAHHPMPREASEWQEVHHQLGEYTDNHATSIPHEQSNLQMQISRPSSLPPAEAAGNQLAPQFGSADSPSLRSTSHFGAAPTTSTDGHIGPQSYSSSQLPPVSLLLVSSLSWNPAAVAFPSI